VKRSIYVVDDQSPVVETTVVLLRHLNADWEVTGFTDPRAALEAVKTKAPDAVLTDQVMPHMLGSELLEQLRVLSPLTVRLIMSGCVPMDKLALITSAHQYMAKPFEVARIKELFQRSFAAQSRIVDRGLQAVATSIRSIPSLPQSHHLLMAELRAMDGAGERIAKLVSQDPGLSVKVMQLANSALFGRGSLVTDMLEAVQCLGTEMISAILLSQSVFKQFEGLPQKHIDLPRIWTHSWETGCAAQRLCREKKLGRQTAEEAFLAGLLHEVGRFILIDNFPDRYVSAFQAAHQSQSPLAVRLRETFQAAPCQLAAYILELWGLPEPVVHGISHMETPEENKEPGFNMTSALYIADRLTAVKFPIDSLPVEPWRTDYLHSIGCAEDVPVWEKSW
jgi:HD-like signal output (HDOD) protein/CheY-like chemotaxis protein